MKAAVHRRYGSPDVVTIDEVPKPVPARDEVLIRVHAATVGIVDSLARRGTPAYARFHFGLRRPRFAVLGSDFPGQAYDVIFDVAGKSSFSRCRPALNRAGVYLTTAPSPAILPQSPWTARFASRKAAVAFTDLRQ
jgi:NADPH:quinone reductase-like Zn-dependent oxidoreductase